MLRLSSFPSRRTGRIGQRFIQSAVKPFTDFLILGGAGLVGTQVCRQLAFKYQPRKIVVASLNWEDARNACVNIAKEFPDTTEFVPEGGNIFVPENLANYSQADIINDSERRTQLLDFVYGPMPEAYAQNTLVKMIERHKPSVIVDCVNTATGKAPRGSVSTITGLSYQNVFDGARDVRHWLAKALVTCLSLKCQQNDERAQLATERFLLSAGVPQIVRHIRLLHQATVEHETQLYLKCGTVGTGGMGLNIPYTHSEDKPSSLLLAKNEAAFGHTGLLFLMARTPEGPTVKEVKPAAMIGYRRVSKRLITDKNQNDRLFKPERISLPVGSVLKTRCPAEDFQELGPLEIVVVDTGENGVFTRGEFEAITCHGQMEYLTPEEIAHTIVQEVSGVNTGKDVIAAVDASVMGPSYKAGWLRTQAIKDIKDAEVKDTLAGGLPSVALGRLGPPALSKLLFEAELILECFGSAVGGILMDPTGATRTGEQMADALAVTLRTSRVKELAASIGVPVLLPDGQTVLRGPNINIPQLGWSENEVEVQPGAVDEWATKGWVDLRPANMEVWLGRIRELASAHEDTSAVGTAGATWRTYPMDEFEIGDVVGHIFNTEFGGHRVK